MDKIESGDGAHKINSLYFYLVEKISKQKRISEISEMTLKELLIDNNLLLQDLFLTRHQ